MKKKTKEKKEIKKKDKNKDNKKNIKNKRKKTDEENIEEEEIEEEEEDKKDDSNIDTNADTKVEIEEDEKKPKQKKGKKKSKIKNEDEENEEEEENEENEEEEVETKSKKKQKTKKKSKKKSKKQPEKNVKFEKEITEAYKKIKKINPDEKSSKKKRKESDDDEDEEESKINLTIKFCEKKLRTALQICINDPYLLLNQKIIDKLTTISSYEKMNLNYIIGEIYISLMSKECIFDFDDEEVEDYLFTFIDDTIEYKELMKDTKLGMKYNDSLKKFLFSITEQIDLEDDELKVIKSILEEDKEIPHNNLMKKSMDVLVLSLSKELEKQPNIYEQYKIFIQNKLSIINLIEDSDIEDKDNYKDYLNLGKYLAYLFYNSSFSLFLRNNEDNNQMIGVRLLFFDGYENKGEMNIINAEQYYIEEDDIIKQLRGQLCEIILKYAEKYIEIIDEFSIQYLIYALVKRMYFYHYEKYNKRLMPILAYSLTNMCFFEEAPLKLISNFINTILKSKEKKDESLKKYILEDLNEAKDEKEFLYKIPKFVKFNDGDEEKTENQNENEKKDKNEEEKEKEEADDNEDENEDEIDKGLSKNKDEVMFLYNNDLKIGFLNFLTINSGKKYIFYEKISQSFSVLDFSLVLEDLDIKVTITDLTENRVIYNKDRLDAVFETPLKIIMLFTSPRIIKFEIDNSYSWMRAKKIRYKTNVFCPKYLYSIIHQILISKYQKAILQTKNKMLKSNKNNNIQKSITSDADQLLIVKLNRENKVYNCINVTQNIEAINKMVKDKYLTITSLFIKTKNNNNEEDKSYFYYYKKDEGLIENELKEEIFEQYLYDRLSKSNGNFNLVNLYVINGDTNKHKHYNYYSINKLLGFEPQIKTDTNKEKTVFIIQNLSQAQLLFQLYKQVYNQESQDKVLLINYSKFGGYQIILFNGEDIVLDLNDFNGVNKSASIDENIDIIYNGIKKLKEDESIIDVVLTNSIDDKENEIVPDKLEEKLREKIGDNENDKKNIKIIKTDSAFNEDLQAISDVFHFNS